MEVNGRRKGEVGNSHGECDDGHGTFGNFGETQMGYFLGEMTWDGSVHLRTYPYSVDLFTTCIQLRVWCLKMGGLTLKLWPSNGGDVY